MTSKSLVKGRTNGRPWRPLARVLAVATALGTLLPVASAIAQTLEDAFIKAYKTNPTLQSQRARVRATDEQVPRALSNWRPTVTFTGEAGKSIVETESELLGGTNNVRNTENLSPREYSLVVSQPLFRGFRTVAEIRRAENRVKAERSRLTSTEQDVLSDAVTAFMDVVRDQVVLDLNVSNEQVLRRQLEATRDRFEVGEVTRTDVAQAEARLARANSDRIQAEGFLDSSRAAYQRVIGDMPGKLVEAPVPKGLPSNVDEAAASATSANPTVTASEYDEKAARDDVDLVTGELLPTLSLDAGLSRAEEEFRRESEVDTAELVARLTVPIYQAGAVHARVREAKQVASQRRTQIDEARRSAVVEAIQAWEDMTAARARVGSFEKESEANQIALEGTEQEAAAGLRTVLDVLDAEQELFAARVNLVRARRDEVVGAYRLLRAVGRLTARDLGLAVEAYDPDTYYRRARGKFIGTGTDEE
ncbi:MAG: TolC family outer membrane protein [Alphaproteobacteria bacterium]